jgi:hypothetical protein
MHSNRNEQIEDDGRDGGDQGQGSKAGPTNSSSDDNGIVGVPDGWEIVRVGSPSIGEHYIAYEYEPYQLLVVVEEKELEECDSFERPVAIVQRKAHWQKLWPKQWRETPLQGRFRNHIDSAWEYGTIVQYRPGQMKWKTADNRWFQYAEVRSMDIPK